MNIATPSATQRPQTQPLPPTMRAAVVDRYGSSDVLRFERLPRPSPGPGEVLVRVRAAAVSRADVVMLTGAPYPMRLAGFGLTRPAGRVPGMCLAGEVVAVGAGAGLSVGEEVYGELPSGAYAEYVVAPERLLARKPATLSFEQAAAVPDAATTALQGLRDVGRVAPGQRVLIIGASGGVGSFAVQIARHLGAEVSAVCSGRNAERVRALGAVKVIDYTCEDFAAGSPSYDLIFDLVGDRSIADCQSALSPTGTYVASAGGNDARWFGPLPRVLWMLATSPLTSRRMTGLAAVPSQADLELLAEWLDAGKIEAVVDSVSRLEEVAGALSYVAEGHSRGRVVVTV